MKTAGQMVSFHSPSCVTKINRKSCFNKNKILFVHSRLRHNYAVSHC